MHGLRRFTILVLVVPATVLLVAFAVANRAPVLISFDPFGSRLLALEQPLYRVAFAALALGVVIGGVATWLGQGKWRRSARLHRAEAARLKVAAEAHPPVMAIGGLPTTGRRRDAA